MFKKQTIFLLFLIFQSLLFSQKKESQIRNFNLIGNDNISDKAILFKIRQKPPNIFLRRPTFEPRLLKLDALTIKNLYHSKGFLDVEVKDSFVINNKFSDIEFKITEGKQYFLSSVDIQGNKLISDERIKNILGLIEGESYNPVEINNNIYKIENIYHNMRKLFFSIKIKDEITDSIKVEVLIDEGKDVSIKNIFLEKAGNIDSSLIYREILFKKGDFFSKEIVDQTSKRLREMGIFSTANLIPVKVANSDSLVNIVIEFRKYKQREWNSSGGYDPISFAEGAPELPALSGTIEWRNRSFFNTPKQFSTKILAGVPVSADFLTPRVRYDASLSGNWFFGLRIPTKITAYFERFILYNNTNNYQGEIDRFGANISQKIQFKKRSFIESKAVWESFSDEVEKKLEERSISFKVNIDRKNQPLFTTKGFLMKGLFKIAGFGGAREYQKIDFTMQNYFPISSKSILASRIQSGKIWGWKEETNSDYSYEKFYLGGSTSMRAWDVLRFKETENKPDGSIIRVMANFEIRSKLYKTLGFTVFTDGGLLEDQMNKISTHNIKWDAGVGITLETPLGPARLDYAFRLDEKTERKIQLGVQSLF